MADQINRIVWQETHHRMEVAYAVREPNLVLADRLVAKTLAEDAGLVLVPSPPGLLCWTRVPASVAGVEQVLDQAAHGA